MNYENFKTGFNKPSIFTAQQYGTKTTVEVDHSDLSLDEVMDAFETLIIGMGYHADALKSWVIDRADEYRETDAEDLKEKLDAWKFDENNLDNIRHSFKWQKDDEAFEDWEKLDDEFFGKMDESEKRMDIIGQNGNEGLHYRATQEDEDEFSDEDYEGQFEDWKNETPDDNTFSDDGGFDGRPHFEWGDEPEEDTENLFEGDEWEANENLKAANERYKKALKTLSAKQKKKSK